MAIQVKKAAVGNAPATGMQKTPRARVFVSGPDIVSAERGPGGGAYGQNHYEGVSSATMDKIPQSPMAAALKVADDGVLSALIAKGSAKGIGGDLKGSSQTRDVSTEGYPPAFGMKPRQSGGTVPSKNGAIDTDYLARRDAAMKRTQ